MHDDDLTLCHCMGITKSTIQDAIDAGSSTFSELVDKTQASTGCGSCAIKLHEMLGDKVEWTAVRVKKCHSIAQDIKSFRLLACDKSYQFPKHQAGHHILVKANIDGQWVARPYAISSMRSELNYREITIKRKPDGVLTEWLFSQKLPIDLLVSDPQGDKFFNIENNARPIICFAGGIGITPVISACRSIYKEKLKYDRFHIDFSMVGRAKFSKQAQIEFKKLITNTEEFSVNLRNTAVEGNICFKDVKQIVNKARLDTLYYISGPVGYELHVQKCLLNANVKEHNIYPLTSKNLSDKVAHSKVSTQNSFNLYCYIGIFLFLSYVIQESFNLKIPALEALQLQEYYKRWTGYGLLAFFSFQWSYPLVRLIRENKGFLAYQKIHKMSGAFAPAILYLHSTKIGYAYLLVLSLAYLINFLLPLCNRDNFQAIFENQKVYKTWLGVHVFLSVMVTSLMLYHVFIAFSYS